MNYYLAEFTQHDGVHEHIVRVVLTAENEQSARDLCQKETYEYGEELQESFFGYGDGETAVSDFSLRSIQKEEYEILRKYLSDLIATEA